MKKRQIKTERERKIMSQKKAKKGIKEKETQRDKGKK